MAVFGRESERARLEQLLGGGGDGDGPSGLLLEGVPGIGKSTLLRDAVAEARRWGWRVIASAPGEADRELAFAGLGDLFDGVAEETLVGLPDPQRRALSAALYLSDARGAAADPDALPRAVLSTLRRLVGGGQLLVAIDDEQWLDPASRRVLAFALGRLRDESICVLIARRPGGDDGVWSALGHAVTRERLWSIEVQPLDQPSTARLIAQQRGASPPRPVLRRIHEVSGGNPLYALTIARDAFGRDGATTADELSIPTTLIDAMSGRLAGLEPAAEEPLLIAAARTDPSLSMIRSVLPDFSVADLDDAIAEGIVEFNGDRLRFTHPLLASAVYLRAAPAVRRALHRRLASTFAPASEEHAHHLALGAEAPDHRTAMVLEQAADQAAGRGAPEVAATLLEHAARLTPADAVDALRLRRVRAAERHFDSGDAARARRTLESVLPELPAGTIRARGLLQLAKVRFDDFEVARELAEQGLIDGVGDERLAAQIESLLGELGTNLGDQTAANHHARAAVGHAERSGDSGLLAQTLAFVGMTAFFAGDGIQEALMARAVALEGQADGVTSYYIPGSSLGFQLLWSDELSRARPFLERSLRRSVDRGEEYDRSGILFHLAHLEWEAGNRDAARGYTDAFIETTRQQADEQIDAYLLWLQAFIAVRRGDLSEAMRRGNDAAELATRVGDAFIQAFASAILAMVELAQGQPDRAHDRLPPLREGLLGEGRGFIGSLTLGLWTTDIEALITGARLDEASETLDDMHRRTSASSNPHAVAVEHRSRGLLVAARGETEAAIRSMELALAEHARRTMPLELGRTLLEKGTLERRVRRKSAAKRSLEQALTVLEPLEAGILIARARDELGRVGLRRAARTGGLTPAQTRVAQFVVSGLTNREIAAMLYMSTRTVETHLTKIYRELGIRSRAQLAGAMAQRAEVTAAETISADRGPVTADPAPGARATRR